MIRSFGPDQQGKNPFRVLRTLRAPRRKQCFGRPVVKLIAEVEQRRLTGIFICHKFRDGLAEFRRAFRVYLVAQLDRRGEND